MVVGSGGQMLQLEWGWKISEVDHRRSDSDHQNNVPVIRIRAYSIDKLEKKPLKDVPMFLMKIGDQPEPGIG